MLNRHSSEDGTKAQSALNVQRTGEANNLDSTSSESLITNHIDIWTTAIERKSSAGRGTSNKFSLYGIKKLRELILELAVRGKLVPQDVNDEPASVLLERIAAEKAQLVKEGKLKKQKPLPEIGEDEKPFELAQGWEWAKFSEIANYGPGRTPSTKNMAFWDDSEEGIPWVSIADLNDVGRVSTTTKKISIDARDQVFKKEAIPQGTMLMSFKLTVGKVSILDIDAFHNEAIISIFPYKGISQDYLFRILPNRANDGNKKNAIMGATLNSESLALINIPVPPLEEQHRIVAKVDELMSLCDALEAQTEASISAHQTLVETLLNALLQPNITQQKDSQSACPEPSLADSLEPALNDSFEDSWQRVAEHFDTLFTTEASIDTIKQTILQLAVMGKLVQQDPNDEPAAKLLERIKAEKAQLIKDKKISKPKSMKILADLELPFEMPAGWQWIRLGDICHTVADGPHFSPQYVEQSEGVTFLSARNISSVAIDVSTAKYVSKADHESFCKRVRVKKGDILYTKGGTTGVAKVNDIDIEFSVWVHVAVLQLPLDKLFNEYVAMALNSPLCYDQSQKYTHGIGNKDLGLTRMINITVPLPPLEEQYRIVAKVDKLMALCEQLKARLSDAQTTQLYLTDAIVEQAV